MTIWRMFPVKTLIQNIAAIKPFNLVGNEQFRPNRQIVHIFQKLHNFRFDFVHRSFTVLHLCTYASIVEKKP